MAKYKKRVWEDDFDDKFGDVRSKVVMDSTGIHITDVSNQDIKDYFRAYVRKIIRIQRSYANRSLKRREAR